MAVGEHPRAAESAGIQVKKYRWIVMVFNGILGGIGGAYLVLVQLGVFTGKYDFRPWLYCSCNCYSWTIYTFWNVWSSSFVLEQPMPCRFVSRP